MENITRDEMKNQSFEIEYYNHVYFTDSRGERTLVAAVRWISDAIALANILEYAVSGEFAVVDVSGNVIHTRKI